MDNERVLQAAKAVQKAMVEMREAQSTHERAHQLARHTEKLYHEASERLTAARKALQDAAIDAAPEPPAAYVSSGGMTIVNCNA